MSWHKGGSDCRRGYHHGNLREALIADVARRGFGVFTETLAEAWDGGRPSPRKAFERLGRGYLDFARREPALYAAMFESGVLVGDHPELREAGEKAFGVLR